MSDASEMVDAYIYKLETMVNEGRIDNSKMDAIMERVILRLIARDLRDIVDQVMAERRDHE